MAWLLDNEELKSKAKKWVDAFLDGQDADGWIGPVQGHDVRNDAYDPWPRFLVFKVFVQYYQATQDRRIIPAMLRFCRHLKNLLSTRPLKSWAKFRWADLMISVFWLYEETGEEWLLPLMDAIQDQGYDWAEHFSNFVHKRESPVKLETHVVNNAMGLKAPAVWYRKAKDPQLKAAAFKGISNLDKFHGQATGLFSGDEHFAGKNPSRGTELCAVVEYMFSLEQLLAITGDPDLGDRLEKITFNALPATFSPDMRAHQYDQQVNQVLCNVAERAWTNGPDANIFGLAPNFGCCTANMHQGWPKFAANLWMAIPEGGLAAVAYAPSVVSTEIQGQMVQILTETGYPFRELLKFTISCAEPSHFPLKFRIPTWAKGATVTLPNGVSRACTPGSFAEIDNVWTDGDVLTLRLPMDIEVERRYHGAVAVSRGPLLYSLKIGEQWKSMGGTAPFQDWEIYPTTSWNYGIVLDVKSPGSAFQVEERPLKKMVFHPENAPVKLSVLGRLIPEWRLENNWAGEIPHSPVRSREVVEKLVLIPYGCTNLRITEFPVVEGD
ncbi:MAG: beta-L-arabinofuranosidase domain-containing protein [Limnochordia bacterium]